MKPTHKAGTRDSKLLLNFNTLTQGIMGRNKINKEGETKECECGCGRLLIRRAKENDYAWATRSYYKRVCARRNNNNNNFYD